MHQIGKMDKQQGRTMGWHKLTDVVADLSLDNCLFRDYEIIAQPTFVNWQGAHIPTGEKRLVCTDNGLPIGKSYSDSFTQFSNKQLLDTLRGAIDGSGLTLESCGTVRDRESRFLTFKLAGAEKFQAGGRDFDAFLNVLDDITGKHQLMFLSGSTCVVCANTFAVALKGEGKNVNEKIRHTKNAAFKLPNISEIIAQAVLSQETFAKKFNKLSEIPFIEEEAKGLFTASVVGADEITPDTFLSRRSLNTADTLTTLFRTGAGNAGRTLADVFSAATDYYTHTSAGGDDRAKQFLSSEFGNGAQNKRDFLTLLDRPVKELRSLAKVGIKAMAFSETEHMRRAELVAMSA